MPEPVAPDLIRSDDPRPVLVTGSTGFIGLEVVRVLCDAGVPTRAMFRRRHRAALVAGCGAELVVGDLTSPGSLERAVDGCRAVIHLGGRATFEPYDRLAPTLVDGTAALVDAAERAGVERLVFGSSLFVHGPDDSPVKGTDSPTTPVLDYGRAKLDAEAALAAGAVSSVAVRLPHVYGWNDLLFGILRSGWLPFPADLDTHFPHLHVTDAARALVAMVDLDATGPVPIADQLSVDWRHFFDVVRTFLPTARIVPLPATPVAALLGVVDRLPIRKPTMLGADTIAGWNLELVVDPDSFAVTGAPMCHPTVDSGIPAVLDAALPYRWRHPVLDRRAA